MTTKILKYCKEFLMKDVIAIAPALIIYLLFILPQIHKIYTSDEIILMRGGISFAVTGRPISLDFPPLA